MERQNKKQAGQVVAAFHEGLEANEEIKKKKQEPQMLEL
jgi:hypothetical protein